MKKKQKNYKQKMTRPPVVVVLGHVDHGKTTLLDYIRKTNIAKTESGLITQHIGAYEIEWQGQKITFIDTPGHEAFSKMRSRGAMVADVALLIIAANEGVKNQTQEALAHIKEAGLPMILVLTKTDLLKEKGNLGILMNQIKELNIQLEEWGGDVPLVKVSSKTGEGINDLLDIILLLGELCVLKLKKDGPAEGVIIESHLNAQRGVEAILIIKQGFLKRGQFVKADKEAGKIKKIFDWQGNNLEKAIPSQPVTVIGFNNPPIVGDKFIAQDEKFLSDEIEKIDERISFDALTIGKQNEGAQSFKLVLKTDVLGSEEAVLRILEKVAADGGAFFHILRRGTGNISEFDIKFASSVGAVILGFRVKTSPSLKELADRLGIKLIACDIIYKIEDAFREILSIKKLTDKEIKPEKGRLEILAVFYKRMLLKEDKEKTRIEMIVGGKVSGGVIAKDAAIEVWRHDKKIGQGKIMNLEIERKPAFNATKDNECGILYLGDTEIKKGDFIISF